MINNLKEVTRLLLYKTAYFFDYPIIPPDTLQFSLTSRCNLFCKMCSVHKYLTKQEEEMPFGEISKIITTAKKQFGIKNLVLTGGEPLLLPELVAQIAAFACKLGIRIILTTNGFYLEKYAQQLGLNMDKFKEALDSGKFKQQIKADQALAGKIGARGAPTFFINGKVLRGAQPFDRFKEKIDAELKKADKLLKKGVKKQDLYKQLVNM